MTIDPFHSVAWRSVVAVADASALLQDLRYSAQGSAGILGELARLGFVVAPSSVISETDKNLVKMASDDAPEPRLRELWDEYKQWIRVVEIDPKETHGVDLETLRERDPRDVPVAAAAKGLRGRGVILTDDLDFISIGLAPAGWLRNARYLREIAVVDATEFAAMLALHGLTAASGLVLRAARAGSMSAQLALVGLAAVAIWAVAREERRSGVVRSLSTGVDRYADLAQTRAEHTRRLCAAPLVYESPG